MGWTWGEIIASFAAIISTIGIGWTLHRDLRDRGILKVDAGFGPMVLIPSGESENCLFISITNVGKRPITAVGVEGKWEETRKDGYKFTIQPQQLPKLFNPGESHTEIYTQRQWCNILVPDLKNIWVRDATGKNWMVSKKDIKKLAKWGQVLN